MTIPAKLNEFNHAEEPACLLLERLGWTYVPREVLAAERGNEREVLLKGRLRRTLMRLNEWMTEEGAERVVFELEHVNAHRHGPQPGRPRVPDLWDAPDLGHGPEAAARAPSASSTSTTQRAASTSSSSPRSSASAGATSEAARRTTSAWSFPTLSSSSTASRWW